jgi:hypothetical protein
MGAEQGKAACHSDDADDDSAAELQHERLDPVTLEPLAGSSQSAAPGA